MSEDTARRDTDHLLPRDGEPDLRFVGTHVAHVSSERPGCDVWTELDLYRAVSGQLVLHKIGMSRLEGHRTRYAVVLGATADELIAKAGRGSLSQELYDEADIEDSEALRDDPVREVLPGDAGWLEHHAPDVTDQISANDQLAAHVLDALTEWGPEGRTDEDVFFWAVLGLTERARHFFLAVNRLAEAGLTEAALGNVRSLAEAILHALWILDGADTTERVMRAEGFYIFGRCKALTHMTEWIKIYPQEKDAVKRRERELKADRLSFRAEYGDTELESVDRWRNCAGAGSLPELADKVDAAFVYRLAVRRGHMSLHASHIDPFVKLYANKTFELTPHPAPEWARTPATVGNRLFSLLVKRLEEPLTLDLAAVEPLMLTEAGGRD